MNKGLQTSSLCDFSSLKQFFFGGGLLMDLGEHKYIPGKTWIVQDSAHNGLFQVGKDGIRGKADTPSPYAPGF